jgi:hypothetical protein
MFCFKYIQKNAIFELVGWLQDVLRTHCPQQVLESMCPDCGNYDQSKALNEIDIKFKYVKSTSKVCCL